MREAFIYMFKDPGYNKKITLYFVIYFITLILLAVTNIFDTSVTPLISNTLTITPVKNPILLLLPFIGALLGITLCGYFFTCIEAVTKQKQNIVLPFLTPKNSFMKGMKLTVALSLMGFVCFLSTVLCNISAVLSTVITVFLVALVIFLLIYSNAFIWLFATEESLLSLFAWKRVLKLVAQHPKFYFKNLIVVESITIGGIILSTTLTLFIDNIVESLYTAWILSSLQGALIGTYITFVSLYLIAKSIKPNSVV